MVTETLAVPLPLASMAGVTVQFVLDAAGGREQDRLTCEAKPFCAAIETALVKVAVWPAVTVCVVAPVEAMAKSGAGVKVKFKTLLPPKATGLGSGGPKELSIMKYVVPPAILTFCNCVTRTMPGSSIPLLQATGVKLPAEPVQIETTVSKLLPEVSRLAVPLVAGLN